MCGIAGALALNGSAPLPIDSLLRMRSVLAHRGPDGAGLYASGPVGLVHTRLAVIDVAGGDQPMANEDGDVHIVFNGEIYNHADLRPELEARGHRYRSRCDTETILHLYEERGAAVAEHLRGMFAFAIWDAPHQRLLLARDRLGIKPLYYASTGTHVLFGSEIKALLTSGLVHPSFDEAVLPEFLSTRFVSGERTFFRGVRTLLPGHTVSWRVGAGPEIRRYWQIPATATDQGDAPTAGEVRGRLEAAVSSHLMSDVPLGVFLSGGIDSTALAALVARQVAHPLQTFAVAFADRDANELEYARAAAGHIGAEHHEVTVTPERFFQTLPRALWHEDEPIAFPSSVPLMLLAQEARRHVTVVLTGEGADELFLGYNRYRITKWNAWLGRPYWAATPGWARRWIRRATEGLPGAVGRLAGRSFLGFEHELRDLYLENFAVLPLASQPALLAHDAAAADPYAAYARRYAEAGSVLDRISRADLETYLLELLMKQDQMSMAASIESRVPFLDDRLVERMVSVPGDVRLPRWQTKGLLRAAVRDLIPPAILTRRKMGFPVPVGRWLRAPFAPVVDEFVLGPRSLDRGLFERTALARMVGAHRAGATSLGDALWLLVNLEIWHRIFCDGEAPGEVMNPVRFHRTWASSRLSRSVACASCG